MPFIALAIIVAAALGGGTSLAAQQALPGDALWGFKVGVNENIRAAIAVDTESQAKWDITALGIRLDEAQKLAAEGKLEANAQAELEANYESHAKAVAEAIAKLQAKGDFDAAADVAAQFQATVSSRATGLAEAQAHADAHAQDVLANVITKVNATLQTATTLSASASAQAAAHEDASDDHGTATESGDDNVKASGGTRVKIDTNGDGEDDGLNVNGNADGSVNVSL
jgi:hypothetical protein